MSQWVGDTAINTKQSCDQQLGSFTQNSGKPGSFTQDPGCWKKRDITAQKLNLATQWHHRIKM